MSRTSVHVVQSSALQHLFTVIRDEDTPHPVFAEHARRLTRILAEEGIAQLPKTRRTVMTPCGEYAGVDLPDPSSVCAVSIVRAGDALLEAVRDVWPSLAVGKILIQRDEETATPDLYYCKLPPRIENKFVLLLDPMLATGGSANLAIRKLTAAGVNPNRIVFLNVVCCPEGIQAVQRAHPEVKIVTCAIDDGLDERKYIVPGLGDFGDRYFGTDGP
mmetsp:Transcript_3525/g.8922  ORF Transcript_3525/g.8922 Transcript_3525/m.8922 type:complete len:217 (+) Transcript_3525:48-698(+)